MSSNKKYVIPQSRLLYHQRPKTGLTAKLSIRPNYSFLEFIRHVPYLSSYQPLTTGLQISSYSIKPQRKPFFLKTRESVAPRKYTNLSFGKPQLLIEKRNNIEHSLRAPRKCLRSLRKIMGKAVEYSKIKRRSEPTPVFLMTKSLLQHNKENVAKRPITEYPMKVNIFVPLSTQGELRTSKTDMYT